MKGNVYITNKGLLVYGIVHHKVPVVMVVPQEHLTASVRNGGSPEGSVPTSFIRIGYANSLSDAQDVAIAQGYVEASDVVSVTYNVDSAELWVEKRQ